MLFYLYQLLKTFDCRTSSGGEDDDDTSVESISLCTRFDVMNISMCSTCQFFLYIGSISNHNSEKFST